MYMSKTYYFDDSITPHVFKASETVSALIDVESKFVGNCGFSFKGGFISLTASPETLRRMAETLIEAAESAEKLVFADALAEGHKNVTALS